MNPYLNALNPAHVPPKELRWVVLYGDGSPDESFWAALQTREEAIWQAYRRRKQGWKATIVEPGKAIEP